MRLRYGEDALCESAGDPAQIRSRSRRSLATDIVVGLIAYEHAGTTYHWRIVATGDAITANGTSRELRFPDVPGVRAFKPTAADTPRSASVALLSANAGVDPLYEIVESVENDLAVFGIAGLDRLVVSIAAAVYP